MNKLIKTTSLFAILYCFATLGTAKAQEKLVFKDSFETRLEQLLNALETQGYEALEDFIYGKYYFYASMLYI